MEKEWRPIPRFEERYLCSEYGDVFSIYSNREISNRMSSNGYVRVNLYLKTAHRTANVHTLVAETFLGKRPEGMQVNHKDGIKTNNHVSNLEYVSRLENVRHAIMTGLTDNNGSKNINSKLSEEDVLDICKKYNTGKFTQCQIANMYNVTQVSISGILTGKRWSHLTNVERTAKKKITDKDTVRAICYMSLDGNNTPSDIAKKLDVGIKIVWSIRSGESWRNISRDILPARLNIGTNNIDRGS